MLLSLVLLLLSLFICIYSIINYDDNHDDKGCDCLKFSINGLGVRCAANFIDSNDHKHRSMNPVEGVVKI